MIFALILALAFSIVAVIFALENPTLVQVSFLGYQAKGSLALFILLAVVLGILIGVIVTLPMVVKRSLALSSHRKKIQVLEKSLDEHKAKITDIEEIKVVQEDLNKPAEGS